MKKELSYEAKAWLQIIGWTGGTIVLCWAMYRWFAGLIGKAIVKELIKAGVIAVTL